MLTMIFKTPSCSVEGHQHNYNAEKYTNNITVEVLRLNACLVYPSYLLIFMQYISQHCRLINGISLQSNFIKFNVKQQM